MRQRSLLKIDHGLKMKIIQSGLNFDGIYTRMPPIQCLLRAANNRLIGKLRYSIIHKGAGRIYGLCMGTDHHNVSCVNVGGDRHLHLWNDLSRDKDAVLATDIAAAVTDPVIVWQQFCSGFRLVHRGMMESPPLVTGGF